MEFDTTANRISLETPILDIVLQAACLILVIAGAIQIANSSVVPASIRVLVAIPLVLATFALFSHRAFVVAPAIASCVVLGFLTLVSLGFGTILLPLGILTAIRHNRRCDRLGGEEHFESGIQLAFALVALLAMYFVLVRAL